MSDYDIYNCEEGTRFYDIAFDWRRDKEADFLEECLRLFATWRKGRILDLCCGGGQFLAEMQSRGWQVAGVDISADMIQCARQRLAPPQILETACMSSFSIRGPFEAATCWLDSLPYLLTNEQIIRHLKAVGRVLVNGGIYLVDMGLGRWASQMWQDLPTEWKPDFP